MSSIIKEGAIFQEAEIVSSSANKAIFRMVLQTCDEKNQNKRMYPKNVLMSAMKNCNDRIKNRAFYSELDHPMIYGNDAHDGMRQTTVLLKEASHILIDYEFQGNKLIGEMESLDTTNGKILLGLLKQKTGVGMSMRGMAELDRRGDVNVVQSPLYIISYDAVSMPSHKAAVVDFRECRFESLNVLQESCSGGYICTPDGRCYLPNYIDALVEKKIITFNKIWL